MEPKDEGPVEWISYWKPNVTINLLDDFTRCVDFCFEPSQAYALEIPYFVTLQIWDAISSALLVHGMFCSVNAT